MNCLAGRIPAIAGTIRFLACALALIASVRVHADVQLLDKEDASPLHIGIGGDALRRVSGGFRFHVPVAVRVHYFDHRPATIHLDFPSSISILGGDSLLHPPADDRARVWTLDCSVGGPGKYVLRAYAVIGDSTTWIDEYEYTSVLSISPSGISAEGTYGRKETVRAGRRYRYADGWLIPLRGPEPRSNTKSTSQGRRPD